MKNKKTVRGLGATLIDNKSYIFICGSDDIKHGTFTVRESDDGITFKTITANAKVVTINGPADDFSECDFFHVSRDDKDYYLTYRIRKDDRLHIAKSKNLIDWEKIDTLTIEGGNSKIISDYLYAGRNAMIVGGDSIKLYVSKDFEKWSVAKKELILSKDGNMSIVSVQVVDDGIFVIYSKNYKDENKVKQTQLNGILFDYGEPTKKLWQSKLPIYETKNSEDINVEIFGATLFDEYFISYWTNGEGEMFLVKHFYNHEDESNEIIENGGDENVIGEEMLEDEKKESFELKRAVENPIMSPREHRRWEAVAAYNPTAIEEDGTTHIIYRADGHDLKSVWGYASSKDGITIENRSKQSIYQRIMTGTRTSISSPIAYTSGNNGGGGCEDPRAVLIDGMVYVTFTAFDGWGSVRVGLTSIDFENFKKGCWNWNETTLISPPGEMNKNWVLFPEKINGKFAILHSFSPDILINYFDSLENFDGETFISSNNKRPVDSSKGWDSWFRGVGPAPLKTDMGWLIFYHAMDYRNPDRYRLGALLLDLNDPTREICRSQGPVLEPQEDYENNGHKWGVIYSCGAVIKDDDILVYYGGADKFVCVAKAPLKEFLDNLVQGQEIKMVIN